MNTVKATSKTEDKLCYCPALEAGNNKGWPKMNAHQKSIVDLIEELAKNKCKRRKKMICKICQNFNHNTADCFMNPMNQLQTLGEAMEGEIRKEWQTRACTKKECDTWMKNLAGCDIFMLRFQYV